MDHAKKAQEISILGPYPGDLRHILNLCVGFIIKSFCYVNYCSEFLIKAYFETPTVGSPSEDQDILEFLDTTGYAFLGSVSLSISTYKTAFCENPNVTLPAAELEEMLSEFAYQHFSAYFQHMQSRLILWDE